MAAIGLFVAAFAPLACQAEQEAMTPAPGAGGKADAVGDSASLACQEALPPGVPIMDVDALIAAVDEIDTPVAVAGLLVPNPFGGCETLETPLGPACGSCWTDMVIEGEAGIVFTSEGCQMECGVPVECTSPLERVHMVWGTPEVSVHEDGVIFLSEINDCYGALCPGADALKEEASALIAAGELGDTFEIQSLSLEEGVSTLDVNDDGRGETFVYAKGTVPDGTPEEYLMIFASEGEHLCGQRYVGSVVSGGTQVFDNKTNGLRDIEAHISTGGGQSHTLTYAFDKNRYVAVPDSEIDFPDQGDTDAGECNEYSGEVPVFTPSGLMELGRAAAGHEVAIRGSFELGETGSCTESAGCNSCDISLVMRGEGGVTIETAMGCSYNDCDPSATLLCDFPIAQNDVTRGVVDVVSLAPKTIKLSRTVDVPYSSCKEEVCLDNIVERLAEATGKDLGLRVAMEFKNDFDLNGQLDLSVAFEIPRPNDPDNDNPFLETFVLLTSDEGVCDQTPTTFVPGFLVHPQPENREVHNGMIDIAAYPDLSTQEPVLFRFDGTNYLP